MNDYKLLTNEKNVNEIDNVLKINENVRENVINDKYNSKKNLSFFFDLRTK